MQSHNNTKNFVHVTWSFSVTRTQISHHQLQPKSHCSISILLSYLFNSNIMSRTNHFPLQVLETSGRLSNVSGAHYQLVSNSAIWIVTDLASVSNCLGLSEWLYQREVMHIANSSCWHPLSSSLICKQWISMQRSCSIILVQWKTYISVLPSSVLTKAKHFVSCFLLVIHWLWPVIVVTVMASTPEKLCRPCRSLWFATHTFE